jgi:DNA-binding transcriptional regulator YiaG
MTPTKEQIKAARKAAGLTQAAAGALVHGTLRTWQDWEYGHNPMHPGLFELFLIKTKNGREK